MHYYTWNIGDYSSHASHLTPIEDVAYRRLLDKYYLSETPICLDIALAARSIGMREYQSEVEVVIREFFTQAEFGWVNKRAEQEIAHYKGKIDQASKAGKASAEARFNARKTPVKRTRNQPITNNQQPLTNNHKKTKKPSVSIPEGMSEAVWKDFLSTRVKAITQTGLNGIASQARLAGITLEDALQECCTRGWQSFRADWINKPQQGTQSGKFNAGKYIRDQLKMESQVAEKVVGSGIAQEIGDDLPDQIPF